MNELVRHIEILLLENDCVVVPGFGGFITHYMPATRSNEDCIFSPPVRSIGFNPQLKMNDGVLVQSYMEVYDTDFPDATRIVEQQVNELIEILHKEGKVDLVSIGELSLSIHGSYVFTSYDDRIISPFLYGLDAFEIQDLEMLRQSAFEKPANTPVAPKKTYDIRINRAVVRNAVAAVAAILLFFYMSTPIENTYVEKENYAQLLPADFLNKIEQQSLITTSVGATTGVNSTVNKVQPAMDGTDKLTTHPEEEVVSTENVVSTPVEVEKPALPASKQYHIIVASVAFEDDAQSILTGLESEGFSNARVLADGKRIRISIEAYSTREEANRNLIELRKNNAYKNAWLLIK